jgi:hypothetical protein
LKHLAPFLPRVPPCKRRMMHSMQREWPEGTSRLERQPSAALRRMRSPRAWRGRCGSGAHGAPALQRARLSEVGAGLAQGL